jgi:hypothetical protein
MSLPRELQARIEAHLKLVRDSLSDRPADERQEIVSTIESHIFNALSDISTGSPTVEDLEAVLAGMDTPESYEDDVQLKDIESRQKWRPVVAIIIAGMVLVGILTCFIVLTGRSINITNTNSQTMSTENTDHKRPPIVASTVPAQGDTNVPPDTKDIRVVFDKDMLTDRMWSWCTDSKDTFPKIDNIRYSDDRTCVADVALEPNRTYVIWFNSGKFTSFRDKYHNPSVPYRLEFRTGSGKEEPQQTKEQQ